MSLKELEMSDKLQQKLNLEANKEEIKSVYSAFVKYNIIQYYWKYMIDSQFRKSVWLHDWMKEQYDKNDPIIEQVAIECKGKTYDLTVQNICRYWYTKMVYKDDYSNYGKFEYWATIEEVLKNYKDDCESLMMLIFLTALKAGVPEYRLFCTIGYVSGNNAQMMGHAYVTYISDNLVMYPIDGTYYPQESMKFATPYFENPLYYYGTQEWARFNLTATYKIK
jgi:hypothetical protein